MSSLGAWKAVTFRSGQRKAVYGFGHDLRDAELWIIEISSGRRIAHIAPGLTHEETEQIGRVIRQAPVLVDACAEAVRRLAMAKHPNAVALHDLIFGALRGMELPLSDEALDRIDQ